jgi:hypothetical protein
LFGDGDASHEQLNALTIATTHAIADTGATSIFIMDGVDVVNKRVAPNPLRINLPDGRQVKSTHTCDIDIPGLPITNCFDGTRRPASRRRIINWNPPAL